MDARTSDLSEHLRQFRSIRVLCVGDVMLDHFVYGEVERISPEAPVPVVQIRRETKVLGGAGNTARNLVELSVAPVLLSAIGDDEAGRELARLLQPLDRLEAHLLVESGRETTTKVRFVAGAQQMLRVDREVRRPLDPVTRDDLLRLASSVLPDVHAVILSDYAKGVLGDGVAAAIIEAARSARKPVIVDPKGNDYERYRGASMIKPNRAELGAATGMSVDTEAGLDDAAVWLKHRYDFGAVLVSLGKDGMMLVEPDGGIFRLPTRAKQVFDVSGAGDTVVAVMAACIGAGIELRSGVEVANTAAGIVVGKIGTATTDIDELAFALRNGNAEDPKLAAVSSASEIVAEWQKHNLAVGATSGEFDAIESRWT